MANQKEMDNTLSGPVDVLAVLDSLIEYHDTSDSLKGRNCIAARAAVAELVEAAKEMNRLAKGPAGGVAQADKRAIIARVDAALANVGGAK